MADFTDIDRVMGVLPILALDSSKDKQPIRDAIKDWITDVSAEVNEAFAAAGISIPIDPASNLFKRIRFRVTRKVGYETMVTRGVTKTKNEEPLWLDWLKQYDDMLKAPAKFAAMVTDGSLPWSSTMDADPNDPSDPKNPTFTKDYVP